MKHFPFKCTPHIGIAVLSTVAVVVILGPLLFPGYVLLLDWVQGPYITFLYHDLTTFMNAPSSALIYGLGLMFPSWVVQKVLLVSLLFALILLPIIFYPWKKESFKYAPYITALFAVCNPFVYERLLSGQWRVLVGYACLFPLFYFLFRWGTSRSPRALYGAFGTLLLTGMWSIHFLALGTVVTGVYIVVHSILLLTTPVPEQSTLRGTLAYSATRYSVLFSTWKHVAFVSLLFLLASMYWIVPYTQRETSTLDHFTPEHFTAFETARDEHIGVVLNVLTMRGFWVERHAWSKQFTLPGSSPLTFYPAILGLIAFAYFGLRSLRIEEVERHNRVFIYTVFPLSVIFASGISALFIWQINYWLLEHVSFWNGFRETHKWTAVVVVLYALLAGRGVAYLHTQLNTKYRTALLVGASVVIALALAPKLFLGLGGQVSAVWYPAGWSEVDALLSESSDCRALFVPWHQYYAVSWNNGQLIGNPASRAFDCSMVTGQNTELGNIEDIADHIPNYELLAKYVTSNAEASNRVEEALDAFRDAGIQYVVVAHDLVGKDIYNYPFLGHPSLVKIYSSSEIDLYEVKSL